MRDECMSTRNNITLPHVCYERAGGEPALTSRFPRVFFGRKFPAFCRGRMDLALTTLKLHHHSPVATNAVCLRIRSRSAESMFDSCRSAGPSRSPRMES